MTVDIRIGDCRELLKAMPDGSVHCVVTSPPYWGLRDYGVAGQLGMERSLGEHIAVMVEVFSEVRRVLRADGTCWINYGDCYATTPNGRSAADTKAAGGDDRTFRDKPFSTIGPIDGAQARWKIGANAPSGPIFQHDDSPRQKSRRGRSGSLGNGGVNGVGIQNGRIVGGGYLKPKDLCMIPNRLAIALQDDGWWVRSEIIWHKPNPMPESIKDRPGSSHEKLWLLAKSERYFYDAEAVEIALAESSSARLAQDVDGQTGSTRANGGRKTNGNMKAVARRRDNIDASRNPGSRPHSLSKYEADNDRTYATRNLRNVWTIPTAAFAEAHFATFPPALVEPCIKAGCPVGGIVLDPFGGAGTVGLVAENLGRDSILLELNPEYAEIARNRILCERQTKVIGMPAPKMRGLPLLDAIAANGGGE